MKKKVEWFWILFTERYLIEFKESCRIDKKLQTRKITIKDINLQQPDSENEK